MDERGILLAYAWAQMGILVLAYFRPWKLERRDWLPTLADAIVKGFIYLAAFVGAAWVLVIGLALLASLLGA